MSSLPKANFQYKSTHDADLVAIGSYGSDAQIAQYYRTQREQVLKEASGKLSKKKELEVLAQFVQAGTVSESDVFARVLRSAEAVRERMESGASKSSFNTFILHFKHYTSTIDRAVQHHAEGASLVWSSVGFMFDVYCNHLKNESELPKALSQALISLMLGERYMRAYILADSSSSAYRSDLDTVNSHWNAATSTALSELYNAVLILCVKAIVYIQGAGKRARVWSAIKPFEEQFHPLITEIHLKKEFLRELAFLSYLPAHRLHTTGNQRISVQSALELTLSSTRSIHDPLRQITATAENLDDCPKVPASDKFKSDPSQGGSEPVGVQVHHDSDEFIVTEFPDNTMESWKLLHEWLYAFDPYVLLKTHKSTRLEGTCSWILSNPLFQSWIAGEQNVFIVGNPGTGKSVLAAHCVQTVSNLSTAAPGDRNVVCLYYFFSTVEKNRGSIRDMISSLIAQLFRYASCSVRNSCFSTFYRAFRETVRLQDLRSPKAREMELRALRGLFAKLLMEYKQLGRILVVLDAVNECSSPDRLLDLLRGFPSSSFSERFPVGYPELPYQTNHSSEAFQNVKFLLTGRPLPETDTLFSVYSDFHYINMANGGVSADIVLFLKDSFRNRFSHLRAALLDEIVEAISKRADGMFRYAAILAEHHDELLYEGLPLSVEQHFQRFPERLAGWYQFILQELEERTLELRRRIFISIAVAARPLTVREVQGICVTDLYHGADTVHDVCKPESLVLPTPAEILAACGGLVEFKSADTAPLDIETGGCAADYFDEEEDYVVVYNQQATVQFINPSVREFLLMPPLVLGSRSGEPSSKVSSCMFGLEAGHRFLASICAVHLRSPRIGDSLSSNKIYCANHGGVDRHGDPISIDPVLIAVFWDSYFCGYALQHWSTHLQSSGVGIIGQDDTILSMQEDTSPEGSSKENAQIFLSRIDSPDDCVCRIDADFVLESYSILFWDKKFIRSRVSFFTMLSKYLYPRPGSSAEYSSLLSKYWTSFFHNSDAEDQFQDNLRSALDQFFFADCVDDRRQLNAINYFNGRYPNRKARLELANVTAYGCCWAQTELVWLYLSVKCFEKDCLLRRSLQYGVDFNSTVQTVGFPTYHLYLWQQHDKNLILPGLFIMRLILDDHTGTQQLCYLEMFLSSKCLDINNKGFYFSSTGPSAKVSGTLLHFLCECMVFHKFHQGGGAFGNDAKIQRNQARRCDSARNLRAMLEMVLERCTDLQINAVNSHGYSALGILLGSSVDRDDFYGGHNNPDLWCYAEEPRRIVAMLEKCGGKAIYPSGRSLFVNKATLLQDVDIAPEFPAGAKNGRWHGEQQFNMGQTVPLTINQNQWRHLSSNGTNVVPKTKSKHPQSDTEGVHKDRLLICGSSEPGSVAAEVSDFREITGDPKPPHNLEDHITGIPATTEAALEATHVAPKNGTARAVTEHQTL